MTPATAPVRTGEPLKPTDFMAGLEFCIKSGRAPMAHGDPGIGKSQMVQQVADRMFAEVYGYRIGSDGTILTEHRVEHFKKGNKPTVVPEWLPVPANFNRPWFVDFRAALRDAVDLMGIPQVVNGITVYARPATLPSDPRGGVFFLDELNRGPELVQNGCFQLALDGKVGEHELPKTWIVASAVNDSDIGARKMSAALNARFIHLDLRPDLEDLCRHAVLRNWEPAVIAFLRFRPDLLHKFNPKERSSPNPRSWEFVSEIVSQVPTKNVEHALFAGAVGEGAAVEFSGFLRLYRELPDIDVILLNPAGAMVPDKPQTQYAVISALARRANVGNFARVLTYLDRLPVEFNVCAVKDMVTRAPELAKSPEFTKWATSHSDVCF